MSLEHELSDNLCQQVAKRCVKVCELQDQRVDQEHVYGAGAPGLQAGLLERPLL